LFVIGVRPILLRAMIDSFKQHTIHSLVRFRKNVEIKQEEGTTWA